MWFASKEEQVKRLHAEGFALLERADLAGAEGKARALLDLGWSGASSSSPSCSGSAANRRPR
jgi:hypothetical protein